MARQRRALRKEWRQTIVAAKAGRQMEDTPRGLDDLCTGKLYRARRSVDFSRSGSALLGSVGLPSLLVASPEPQSYKPDKKFLHGNLYNASNTRLRIKDGFIAVVRCLCNKHEKGT